MACEPWAGSMLQTRVLSLTQSPAPLPARVPTGHSCMPPKDPSKFVRTLAPYLKVSVGERVLGGGRRPCRAAACGSSCAACLTASGRAGCPCRCAVLARHQPPTLSLPCPSRPAPPDPKAGGGDAARRGAEALLCVLSVLDGVLSQLSGCEAGTLPELLADVLQLINKHPFVQVLAGAAACLTTLAGKEPEAAAALANSAAVYAGWLRDPAGQGGGARPAPALLCRFLYILGPLCRRGADVLERTPPEGGGGPLGMAECQRIFVQYCGARENLKVRLGLRLACWLAAPCCLFSVAQEAWRCGDAGPPREAAKPKRSHHRHCPSRQPHLRRWRRRRWARWAHWPSRAPRCWWTSARPRTASSRPRWRRCVAASRLE